MGQPVSAFPDELEAVLGRDPVHTFLVERRWDVDGEIVLALYRAEALRRWQLDQELLFIRDLFDRLPGLGGMNGSVGPPPRG